jgi:hypothetical protein
MDTLYEECPDARAQIFFDSDRSLLAAEDPQFMFFLGRASIPAIARSAGKVTSQVMRVFISYSHQDQHWLQRLQVHLKPLARDGIIDPWSDKRIEGGALWKREIGAALSSATAAVLLISADFLASDFIVDHELPELLRRSEREGVLILPVLIGPCRFGASGLSEFQCVNDPSQPVASMAPADQELIWARVADRIERAAQAQ